ncbi:MAG TPA: hypothetical protein VFR28_01815 [Allosphingosinicella sp.]|jgi:hypothetical protein|nr:hypothetical protein [Allosphingosinicella sp.]
MKKTLLILLFLAACGRDDPAGNNQAAAPPAAGSAGGKSSPASAGVGKGGGSSLAGLYEGGSGPQKNQLCIVEKAGDPQFGMLVWGSNLNSCSGAGRAEREGERLTLTMTGDETCRIDASLKDGAVTLPAKLPLGCAYYCAANASFAGARFTKSGSSAADVKKATDIAGDPLCD